MKHLGQTIILLIFMVVLQAYSTLSWSQQAQQKDTIKESEVKEAYNYFIGRLLILRQENRDFKNNGYEWNKLFPRKVGEVAWANPNLDVAYSEAWIAIDKNSCAIVDIPQIKERYYTLQVLNSWGETVSNINERTMPRHPFGKFAYCTKDSKVRVADNIERITLDGKKFKVLARIELGASPDVAVQLQSEMKLTMQGTPKIEDTIKIPEFSNQQLLGAEAFDKADTILKSEPDINPGMEKLQENVRKLAVAVKDKTRRAKLDQFIKNKIVPEFLANLEKFGTLKNGWRRPEVIGNYGTQYLDRSLVNLGGIWANNKNEAIYIKTHADSNGNLLNGSHVYTMTFPKNAMPQTAVKYFWSVIAVDSTEFKIIPNPENKFQINDQTPTVQNKDGSITLIFANALPQGFNKENWIPTAEGQNFNLTFRLYGPKKTDYFPPPVVRMVRSMQAQETKPTQP